MTRSVFFTISAVLVGIFGLVMIVAPAFALANFGLGVNSDTINLGRGLGTLILAVGILNYLVRNHPDSQTLAANGCSGRVGYGNDVLR